MGRLLSSSYYSPLVSCHLWSFKSYLGPYLSALWSNLPSHGLDIPTLRPYLLLYNRGPYLLLKLGLYLLGPYLLLNQRPYLLLNHGPYLLLNLGSNWTSYNKWTGRSLFWGDHGPKLRVLIRGMIKFWSWLWGAKPGMLKMRLRKVLGTWRSSMGTRIWGSEIMVWPWRSILRDNIRVLWMRSPRPHWCRNERTWSIRSWAESCTSWGIGKLRAWNKNSSWLTSHKIEIKQMIMAWMRKLCWTKYYKRKKKNDNYKFMAILVSLRISSNDDGLVFYILSTLFESYWDNGRMIMKFMALCNEAPYSHALNSASRGSEPGTSWSEVRNANHSAILTFQNIVKPLIQQL